MPRKFILRLFSVSLPSKGIIHQSHPTNRLHGPPTQPLKEEISILFHKKENVYISLMASKERATRLRKSNNNGKKKKIVIARKWFDGSAHWENWWVLPHHPLSRSKKRPKMDFPHKNPSSPIFPALPQRPIKNISIYTLLEIFSAFCRYFLVFFVRCPVRCGDCFTRNGFLLRKKLIDHSFIRLTALD